MKINKKIKYNGLFYSIRVGDLTVWVDPEFAKKQGIKTQERLDAIFRASLAKHDITNDMSRISLGDSKVYTDAQVRKLHELYDELFQIENRINRLFGLPESTNYYKWTDVPHCSCVTKLNSTIPNYDCPVHGPISEHAPKMGFFEKIKSFMGNIFNG